MNRRCLFGGAVAALFSALASSVVLGGPVFSDDFEDGVVDSQLWTVGGRRLSWTPSDQGSWTYTQTETYYDSGDADGYLKLHVQGPYTGNSYGAVSWLQTKHNFNDGRPHIQNFTWRAQVAESHQNSYFVQVTDGYLPTFSQSNWGGGWIHPAPPDGTSNLLWDSQDNSPMEYTQTTVKETWSIAIDPEGSARLFKGPNASGSLLGEATLDRSKPWFRRLMVFDATSLGFGAGEANLNLYSFSEATPRTHVFAFGVNFDRVSVFDAGLQGGKCAESVAEAFRSAGATGIVDVMSAGVHDPDLQGTFFLRLKQVLANVHPGDTFVLYVNTHGGTKTTGDENDEVSISGKDEVVQMSEFVELEDDGLYTWLNANKPDGWDQVDKLFIVDSCHSGGFWGGGDAGDLERFGRAALLSSARENTNSQYRAITGISLFGDELSSTVSTISVDGTFEVVSDYVRCDDRGRQACCVPASARIRGESERACRRRRAESARTVGELAAG